MPNVSLQFIQHYLHLIYIYIPFHSLCFQLEMIETFNSKVHVLLIQNLCSLMLKVLLHFSCSLAGWD